MKQHLLLLVASLPSAHGALLSSRRPLPSSCRAAAARALLGFGEGSSPPQTVDEARQKFFAAYGKPYVAPDAQGFVNELLGSSQMAIVSPSFRYNAVFALGTEALCETFLAQRPEAERVAITDAIITALGMSPQQLKSDAAALRETAKAAGTEEALLGSKPMLEIKAYPKVPPLKYSYAFGAGMLTLMPLVEVKPSDDAIDRWVGALEIDPAKGKMLKRDFAFFESSQDKLAEMRQMMAEMQASAKRKEAAKLKEQAEAAAAEAAAEEAASEGAKEKEPAA